MILCDQETLHHLVLHNSYQDISKAAIERETFQKAFTFNSYLLWSEI